MATSYDPNKDYTTAIRDAIARGASVAEVNALNNERNAKIAASGGALNQYKDDVKDLVASYTKGVNSYFPSSSGNSSVPSGYVGNADVTTGTVKTPSGNTASLHDWSTDTTDYSALMKNAKSPEEFNKYAQDRVSKAAAQGIDISQGNANGYKSNTDLYNEWYAQNGPQAHDYMINGVTGTGYYGMDGNGNWGYYDDPALTQKSADGGWDSYRSSDGKAANFEYDTAGRLMPSAKRDESRAGQTVTVATGNKAYRVEYDGLGYVRSIAPVNVDVSTLEVAQYDPSRDRGVSGRDLLLQTEGVSYAGPGANIDQSGIRGATRADWDAVMAGQGYTPQPELWMGTYDDNTGGRATDLGGNGYAPVMPTMSGGNNGTTPSPAIEDLLSQYRDLYGENGPFSQALAQQRAANEAAVQRAVNELERQKTETNSSYSDLFRQLYIDRMRNQKNIDQRMAAQGITGGLAESTLLNLGTQYEDALRQGEQSRIDAISDIDLAIEDARLTGDIENAEAAASATQARVNNYANVLKALISRQDTINARQEAYAREDALRQESYAREDALRQAAYAREDAQRQAAYATETATANRSYAYKTAMQLINSGYMPSEPLLAAAGIETAAAQALVASVQAERTAEAEKAAAAGAKPLLTAAQVNAAIKAGNLTPAVLSAYEYYYGQPYGGR